MATQSEPTTRKSGKAERLGWSAAAGTYILKPASKGGSVSTSKIKAAIQKLNQSKT